MAEIITIKDRNGKTCYPVTAAKAVFDSNGKDLESLVGDLDKKITPLIDNVATLRTDVDAITPKTWDFGLPNGIEIPFPLPPEGTIIYGEMITPQGLKARDKVLVSLVGTTVEGGFAIPALVAITSTNEGGFASGQLLMDDGVIIRIDWSVTITDGGCIVRPTTTNVLTAEIDMYSLFMQKEFDSGIYSKAEVKAGDVMQLTMEGDPFISFTLSALGDYQYYGICDTGILEVGTARLFLTWDERQSRFNGVLKLSSLIAELTEDELPAELQLDEGAFTRLDSVEQLFVGIGNNLSVFKSLGMTNESDEKYWFAGFVNGTLCKASIDNTDRLVVEPIVKESAQPSSHVIEIDNSDLMGLETGIKSIKAGDSIILTSGGEEVISFVLDLIPGGFGATTFDYTLILEYDEAKKQFIGALFERKIEVSVPSLGNETVRVNLDAGSYERFSMANELILAYTYGPSRTRRVSMKRMGDFYDAGSTSYYFMGINDNTIYRCYMYRDESLVIIPVQ